MSKWIIIVLIVGIVLLLIFFIMQSLLNPSNSTVVPSPTPTSIKNDTDLLITSLSPPRNGVNISDTAEIVVTFSRELTSAEEDQMIFSASPSIDGYQRLSTDKKTFTVTPKNNLQLGQKYQLSIKIAGQDNTWSFTTASKQIVTTQEQIQEQAKADKNFGDWDKSTQEKYPWLNSLPIQKTEYYVYFDIEKGEFYGKLYPQQGTGQSEADQVEAFKSDIIKQLQALSVDTSKYKINWEVKN